MSFISNYAGPVYFVASRSADLSNFNVTVFNNTTTWLFDTILEHSASQCYDVQNQCFTAPVSGLYFLQTKLSIINDGTTADDSISWGYKIVRNSGLTTYRLSGDNFDSYTTSIRELTFTNSITVTLYAGDKVYLYGEHFTTGPQILLGAKCYHMGQLITRMTNIISPALPYAEYATKITLYNPDEIEQNYLLYMSPSININTPSNGAISHRHTLTSTTNYMLAIVIGGGGGGGGGNYQNGGSNGGGGGGGGAGAVRYGYYSVTPGSVVDISVGYGGLGGSSPGTTTGWGVNAISTQQSASVPGFDASSSTFNVGGSGQVGANSTITYNGIKLLDASGGRGSISVTAGTTAAPTATNTSIFAVNNGGFNNAGGIGGIAGSGNGSQSTSVVYGVSGSFTGNNGASGGDNANSGGGIAGGVGGINSFTNFGLSGRNFFPPIGATQAPSGTSATPSNTGTYIYALSPPVNNVVLYDLTIYGRGGNGGRGEGSSTNGMGPGISGRNGAVIIFEYSA